MGSISNALWEVPEISGNPWGKVTAWFHISGHSVFLFGFFTLKSIQATGYNESVALLQSAIQVHWIYVKFLAFFLYDLISKINNDYCDGITLMLKCPQTTMMSLSRKRFQDCITLMGPVSVIYCIVSFYLVLGFFNINLDNNDWKGGGEHMWIWWVLIWTWYYHVRYPTGRKFSFEFKVRYFANCTLVNLNSAYYFMFKNLSLITYIIEIKMQNLLIFDSMNMIWARTLNWIPWMCSSWG